jgi:hypothetical protein
VIAFLMYSLSHLRDASDPTAASTGRLARRSAVGVALANLSFLGGLAVFFRGLGGSVPPGWDPRSPRQRPMLECEFAV